MTNQNHGQLTTFIIVGESDRVRNLNKKTLPYQLCLTQPLRLSARRCAHRLERQANSDMQVEALKEQVYTRELTFQPTISRRYV